MYLDIAGACIFPNGCAAYINAWAAQCSCESPCPHNYSNGILYWLTLTLFIKPCIVLFYSSKLKSFPLVKSRYSDLIVKQSYSQYYSIYSKVIHQCIACSFNYKFIPIQFQLKQIIHRNIYQCYSIVIQVIFSYSLLVVILIYIYTRYSRSYSAILVV